MKSRSDEMTPTERREAEIARGAQVIVEKHGARPLADFLAQEFDPEFTGCYSDPNQTEGAKPSKENKAYRERMQRQVPNR